MLPGGESVLLTDTVGFIRKLPHHLVKAFRSTLDEAIYADILLIVSDATDPEAPEHIEVTREVLSDIGASDKPIIYVYNKCDLLKDTPVLPGEGSVAVSGATGYGIDELLAEIERVIGTFKIRYKLLIPYTDQSAVSAIYSGYSVEGVEYAENGTLVSVVLDERGRGLYEKYII